MILQFSSIKFLPKSEFACIYDLNLSAPPRKLNRNLSYTHPHTHTHAHMHNGNQKPRRKVKQTLNNLLYNYIAANFVV